MGSHRSVDALRHAELLAPGIQAVLDEAWVSREQLTGVAVGVGPGPFTGLRVGLVTARTLGLVLGVPVHGVCTLDVLAAQAVADGAVDGPFTVATDARRKEVYHASYDGRGRRLDGPHVSRPADVATSGPVVGTGPGLYPEAFPHPVGPTHPDAGVLAALVLAGDVEVLPPDPLYLRRPDVAEPTRPKPVS